MVKVKGLVDAFRNPRPDYYHVKVAYAPLSVDPKPIEIAAGHVTVHIANRFSFTDLSETIATATLLNENQIIATTKPQLKLAPLTDGPITLDFDPRRLSQASTLLLCFDHADGGNIVTYDLTLKPHEAPSPELAAIPPTLHVPKFNLVAVTFPKNARNDGSLPTVGLRIWRISG